MQTKNQKRASAIERKEANIRALLKRRERLSDMQSLDGDELSAKVRAIEAKIRIHQTDIYNTRKNMGIDV